MPPPSVVLGGGITKIDGSTLQPQPFVQITLKDVHYMYVNWWLNVATFNGALKPIVILL